VTEPTAEELDADIDYVHLARPDGTCVISMNGQGHFPCDQHFTHRDGKQCWREGVGWMTKYILELPADDPVWEGEEPPTSQPCARSHDPRLR
jgi:hypothetical protein